MHCMTAFPWYYCCRNKEKELERVIIIAATIRDVAALAGVSPSTVSRTCRNSSSISEKTQEKVRQAMAQLGYEPPGVAETPQENAGRTIGVLLPPSMYSSFENPFFLEVLRGISQYSNEKKVLTALITGSTDQELLETIKAHTRNRSVNAYIVLFSRVDDPVVEHLYNEGIDYVQIGQPSNHPNETVAVDNDNISAGQDAARYLLGLGHTRIAFVGAGVQHWYSVARRNGVRLCLQDQGLDLKPEWTIEAEADSSEPLDQLRAILDPADPERPTAIIAADEMHAIMVRQICAEAGLQVPRDISLVSFNNSIVSHLTAPALTSIDVNAQQLGIEAALQAIKHLENPSLMPSRTLVPYKLIERDSSRDLNEDKEKDQ